MRSLENYKVLITGGAQGIGRAIVKAFDKAGAQIAFCDHDQEAGILLLNELSRKALFYHIDVTNVKEMEELMQSLFAEWGNLDILINNVGIGGFRPLTEMTVEQFDQVINTNLRPVFITSASLARQREKAGIKKQYGRIINLSSSRFLQSEPGTEAYSASKGGIVSLTHALAISFSNSGVTVNSISPGWIETKSYDSLSEVDHLQHPSGRVGIPDDIARCCLFLCEPGNDFINGQNIIIDGGMTRKMIYEE